MRLLQFGMMVLLTAGPVTASAVEAELQAEQWELSRNAERLLGIGELTDVVNTWSADSAHQIELQYPGGEEGELWVSQLADWLVALGVPSTAIVAVPGSGQGDVVRLRVIISGENFR